MGFQSKDITLPLIKRGNGKSANHGGFNVQLIYRSVVGQFSIASRSYEWPMNEGGADPRVAIWRRYGKILALLKYFI